MERELVKNYGSVKVYLEDGHFVIFLGDTRYCSLDTWKEVQQELRSLDI